MSTFSLEQISKTINLVAFLILQQHKLNSLAQLMEIIINNPELKQDEVAKEPGFSSFTLQCYGYDIKMQSPHKSNNPERTQKTPSDLKTPKMTSNEPVIADSANQAHSIKPITNKKNKMKGGSVHGISDEYLDRIICSNINL